MEEGEIGMTWLQGQDPVVVMTAFLCALLVAPVFIYVVLRLLGRRAEHEHQGPNSPTATPAAWPPGAADNAEPYQLYFEQLNSMLEPVEPFSLDHFKANCALPPPPIHVRFDSEGGFTTEPALPDGERR
jgi:hypothetical protein